MTGETLVLQSMGWQRVGHNLVIEQQQHLLHSVEVRQRGLSGDS